MQCSAVMIFFQWDMKLEFNKALVPVCIFYFALFFSFNLVFPYFTLQLRTLGLTLDDAALIGGDRSGKTLAHLAHWENAQIHLPKILKFIQIPYPWPQMLKCAKIETLNPECSNAPKSQTPNPKMHPNTKYQIVKGTQILNIKSQTPNAPM